MTRTVLTTKRAPGQFAAYGANVADQTMTAADVANKNSFVYRPGDLIIAHNTGASPYTVTITSVAAFKTGRTGDIGPYTLAAGVYAVFGPFTEGDGFLQADGSIYLEASNAAVKFGIIEQ